MAVCKGEIGRLVDVGLGSFLWEIPAFSGLPKEEGIFFESPYIHLAETVWRMFIYQNGVKGFFGRILLGLVRCYVGTATPPKTFHCTVGVRRAGGEEEEVGTQTVKFGCWKYVIYQFDKRAKDCEEGDCLAADTLTLTLRIREEVEAASQSGLLNSHATRMECSNCRYHRQNDPTQEESSSSETKGLVTLSQNLKDLYISGKGCDVKFKVNNKSFSAHQSILGARTPVLAAMLTENWLESDTGVVTVEDCDPESFEVFLIFLYSGTTKNLTTENVMSVYYIADKYQVPDLKSECVLYMISNLTVNSICNVLRLALKVDDKFLLEESSKFFQQNAKEIFCTSDWETFMVEHSSKAKDLIIKYANEH